MTSLKKELLEPLAKIEHEQWSHWSKDIADRETVSYETLQRWEEFWDTPWEELDEENKSSDFEWAEKVIEVVEKHTIPRNIPLDHLEECEECGKLIDVGTPGYWKSVDDETFVCEHCLEECKECGTAIYPEIDEFWRNKHGTDYICKDCMDKGETE